MNGDSTRVESADTGRPGTARERRWEALNKLREASAILLAITEYKAAREVDDARDRYQALLEREDRESFREGERRS